ncbi:preprotein translocase subunit YajC [Kribbella sp. VKM Ac-2571]|uniref:preprotein translocase subunit YajC n=1 Tax=Kribbella sp. VKM Ac-2571 TaxID=2512222 RepID=UPI00105F0E53|nr:preprotein translocase subunit YajC [Kribbella sp. VKM Ac-2571]TDO52853.1 preprotein translocase subunit YajC [Kribbella sp. VKM Ac-2571]
MQLLAVPMASSGGGGITLLLPLILIVGMIWFMSRSQKKQRQRQAETVASLSPGTKVITTSGLVGIVEETDDDYVTLEISEGVLVQVVKAAVGRVIPEEDAAVDEAESVDEAATTDADEEAEKVDVPDAGKAGDKADGKVQDTPKLPPTHTEN